MRNSILVMGWLHTNVRFLSNGIHRLNHALECQFENPFSACPTAFLCAEKTNDTKPVFNTQLDCWGLQTQEQCLALSQARQHLHNRATYSDPRHRCPSA